MRIAATQDTVEQKPQILVLIESRGDTVTYDEIPTMGFPPA